MLDVDHPAAEVGEVDTEDPELRQQLIGIAQPPLDRVDKHPGVADQVTELAGHGAMIYCTTVQQILIDTGQLGDPGFDGRPGLRLDVPAPDHVVVGIGVRIADGHPNLNDIRPIQLEVQRHIRGVPYHDPILSTTALKNSTRSVSIWGSTPNFLQNSMWARLDSLR